jgi:glycosyltransferase involved in cell wall biosynthesis
LFGATRGRLSQLIRALAVLPRSFDILDRLENDPPDVLHAEWGHYPTIVARLVQQRLPRTVVSVSLIAYDLTTEFGGTIDVVRSAEVVRTQTRANVTHISRFAGIPESRIAVVHDGVEFSRIRRVDATSAKVAGRCVAAGRLVPAKGIDAAIRVFAAARAASTGATLRIMGTGPDQPRLRRLAAELGVLDAVEFLGHVPHEQAIQEFANAEILLHLSHSERLPNVVKEAMACHCACVTTRTVGIEELVDDGVTGFIVEHGDIETAVGTVVKLLAGDIPARDIGDAAHRFIAAHFDHESNVRMLAAMWTAALSGTDRDPTTGSGIPLEAAHD